MNTAPIPYLRPLTDLGDDFVIGPPCHLGGIRGMGNTKHGVMIIGIAPGRDEMKTGKPLTGPTGRLFDQLLAAVGFPRNQVYVTNMCCTYVEGKITAKHMDRCQQRLKDEIEQVQPRLIITLGTEVCQYWLGQPITKARGAVIWNEEYNCYLLPMIQPAALFHTDLDDTTNANTDRISNAGYDIVRDLRKIPTILEYPPNKTYNHVDYTVVATTEEAQRILDSLPQDGTPVALDVETNHHTIDVIDIKQDDLICLAISTGAHSWVFPVAVLQHPDRAESLVHWPHAVNWTFHNAVFDTAIVHRFLNVWLPVGEDTMLLSYACDERPGYHGLKPLAREFEAAGFWERDRVRGDLPKLYEYNAKDAAYTARLAPKLTQWANQEQTYDMYRTLLIPAVNVFKEIQDRGARIDAQLLSRLETEWGDERELELARMQDAAYDAGWPDHSINLNSPLQLSKLLYKIIGLFGGPSTAKDVLETLRDDHPFVNALIEYRHLERNYKTYVDAFCFHIRIHGVNHGRVHPTVKLHGTVTGRRSYGDPPVQTIPRPSNYADKYGLLRQAFIPTNDDYEIAYVDYSRAEIYTAFGYSQDPVMWEALQKDYHLETAVNVMHKSRARMMEDANYREEMRRIAKVVTFGILYGMEEYTLSQTAGISVNEARAYINQFFVTNARYSEFYQRTLRELERTGEVVSITGRKRRFVMLQPNPRVLKQAVNFSVQSTAGDLTLMAAIKLHPLLKKYDSYILFDVHDALVFEISKKYKHIVLPLIKEVMEAKPFPDIAPDFPGVPTEVYCGRSWGQAEKVKVECLNA